MPRVPSTWEASSQARGISAKPRRSTERPRRPATEGCLDEAYLNLGLILLTQERFEEAAECLREAIQRDPGYRVARKALRDVERMPQGARPSVDDSDLS